MKLPEKKWLTITELAQKWDVGTNDVLHMVETGQLIASIKIKTGTYLERLVFDSEGKYQGSVDADERYQGGIAEYRVSTVLMEILNVPVVDWNALKKSTEGHDISRQTIVGCRKPTVFWGFKEPFCIVLDDLLFTIQEINRFEAEHGLTGCGIFPPILSDSMPEEYQTAGKEDIIELHEQPIKKKPPPQLDRKDSPRGIGLLIKKALQAYYKEKGKGCDKLSDLVDMMRSHKGEKYANHKNPYLKDLVSIGETDIHYLSAKTSRGSKWYTRNQAQRNFREQTRKAVYPLQ